MAKNYLRSDFSQEEFHYFTDGRPIIGESNTVTSLFKYIGRYSVLREEGRENDIATYNPDSDRWFKYENAGYTEMNKTIKSHGYEISRKYLINVSRKWSPSRVVLSFKTDVIISELLTYILSNPYLQAACKQYLINKNANWHSAMPIQFSFLGTRYDRHGPRWEEAGRIINTLPVIEV